MDVQDQLTNIKASYEQILNDLARAKEEYDHEVEKILKSADTWTLKNLRSRLGL